MPSDINQLGQSELLALVESSHHLAEQVEVQRVVQSILEKAGSLTESPETSVILYNKSRNTLFFAGATGEMADQLLLERGEFGEKQIPVEGSIAGSVFKSGTSIVENEVEQDPKHYKEVDRDTKKTTKSMVCVPLLVGGETLGVMQLLNSRRGRYTDRDRVMLEHFADHAAIAIRNAKLLEQLLAHMGLYASRQGHSPFDLALELEEPAHDETLTVLFADLRGFTRLCQALESRAQMQLLLNQFLTMLSQEVLAHDGLVNKFMGDGLLAIFRGENHAERGVRAAFAMVESFRGLPEQWQDNTNASLDFLDIGIGIATDKVIIGSIGSEHVRDFTVMGTAVNLASALEQHARGGKRILVSQKTFAAVKTIVGDAEGPENFMLRKPDQEVGHSYNRYHVKSLKIPVGPRLFISHSREDRTFVDHQLVEPLNRSGVETWYCSDDIPMAEEWVRAVHEGLDKCNWFVVVVSKNAAGSEWVRREVDLAVSMERYHRRIIPVLLDDTDPNALSSWLGTVQWLDARETPSIADDLKRGVC